jgi:hypothetical protein
MIADYVRNPSNPAMIFNGNCRRKNQEGLMPGENRMPDPSDEIPWSAPLSQNTPVNIIV